MRARLLPALFAFLTLGAPAAAQTTAPMPPRVGGYVQVRESYVEPTRLTATLNRARFSLDGSLPARFSYRFLVELEADAGPRTAGAVSLREAIARWSAAPYAIQAGQFKTPFSREYLIPVPALETPDFAAVVDTLAPKYDIGVMGEYSIPMLTLSAGVFNGEGQNAGLNRDSTVLAVARLGVRPLPQAILAGSLARYSADSLRYGADVTLEQSGVMVRGEVLGQRKRGRPRDDFGWYALATCRVVTWLQLVAKQEDFQRPSLGQARRISATTVGVNVELPGGRTRILLAAVSRAAGFPRVRRNTAISQLQLRF